MGNYKHNEWKIHLTRENGADQENVTIHQRKTPAGGTGGR